MTKFQEDVLEFFKRDIGILCFSKASHRNYRLKLMNKIMKKLDIKRKFITDRKGIYLVEK